jgi:hypothetical protein
MKFDCSKLFIPHPIPLPQRGEGVPGFSFPIRTLRKKDSLVPSGERVRVRGYAQRIFMITLSIIIQVFSTLALA